MITDIAVERVEFRCPESHWQSVVDYDVVVYVDAEGDAWEFYSKDGVPSLSPYTVDGAPLCPVCHRVVVGTPVARRLIPGPPGEDRRPREPVSDLEAHRAEQRNVPLLPGTSRPAPALKCLSAAAARTAAGWTRRVRTGCAGRGLIVIVALLASRNLCLDPRTFLVIALTRVLSESRNMLAVTVERRW